MAARRATLYACDTKMAKYFGRKKGGEEDLALLNRSLNHFAGLARLGSVSTCLKKIDLV